MMLRHIRHGGLAAVISTAVLLGLVSTPVSAKKGVPGPDGSPKNLTLVIVGDLHATMAPHASVFTDPDGNERYATQAGGLARLKTKIDEIKDKYPNSLVCSVGDFTHGGPEALFTLGDAMMKAGNQLGIDVFTPGNWDFAYGPNVFRNRFTKFVPAPPPFPDPVSPRPPLPPNQQVSANYVTCDGVPGCTESNGVIQAGFPTVAINVYNEVNTAPLPAPLQGKRVVEPYRIFDKKGIKIAVIGITAAIVPQQAGVFNIGLRFTQGVEELPGILDEVREKGADIVMVQSELGLAQNVEIARRFKDIDVMYSAHTHEITHGALIVDQYGVTRTKPRKALRGRQVNRLARGAALVVETDRDRYVGQLDLQVAGKKIVGFRWQAHAIDSSVAEDANMAALVDSIRASFLSGPEFIEHVFLPGGFGGNANQRGLRLQEPLDTVVGETEVLLHRGTRGESACNSSGSRCKPVLESAVSNFIADAIWKSSDAVIKAEKAKNSHFPWDHVDLGMFNGFRFGNPVLPATLVTPGSAFADGRNPGEITLGDLWTWLPIGAAVSFAEFSGAAIEASLEEILSTVFHRNPFEQRGGWYLGLANMTQTIDLDNRPYSSSGGRIVKTTLGADKASGEPLPLDPSKRYLFASCYPHGDPLDKVCRTSGGAHYLFFEFVADGNGNYSYASDIGVTWPVNEEFVLGPPPKQVAPDRFVHGIDLIRRYLASGDLNGVVPAAMYDVDNDPSLRRITTVNSAAADAPPAPEQPTVDEWEEPFVQPPRGAGPRFYSGRVGDFEDL